MINNLIFVIFFGIFIFMLFILKDHKAKIKSLEEKIKEIVDDGLHKENEQAEKTNPIL